MMSKKLVLFGGGPKPKSALKQFLNWATPRSASPSSHVLIVGWASAEPSITVPYITKKLSSLKSDIKYTSSPTPPASRSEKIFFLNQLEKASGVFFSGGDQSRVADLLNDRTIYRALHDKYLQGVAFGGTSAGTAIMSEIMIAGDDVPYREGLGLLNHIILDQHFLLRKRQARLQTLIDKYPHLLGVGIDEGAALSITENRFAKVIGPEKVMILDRKQKLLLSHGNEFDFMTKLMVTPLSSPPLSPYEWVSS